MNSFEQIARMLGAPLTATETLMLAQQQRGMRFPIPPPPEQPRYGLVMAIRDEIKQLIHEQQLEANKMFGGERKKLSQWIQDNYPKTRDAVLVAKWFGGQLDGDCGGQVFVQFLIRGREQALLEFAKELEEKEKKVRAEGR